MLGTCITTLKSRIVASLSHLGEGTRLLIRRTFGARWRVVAPLLLGLIVAQAFATPALADDPPGTQPFTVTRGGQTFERSTFEVELAPDGRLMRAGSFIVKFLSQADPAEREDAHRISGALGAERLLSADTLRVQVGRSKSLAALMAYATHRAVERVEPDYVAHTMPDDPSFLAGDQWGMTKIGADSAWGVPGVSSGSAGVRIAILDCGVYHAGASSYGPGHPDINGKVLGDKNFTTSLDADDFCNHGTHVAGIAAANTDNGVGVAGVGYDARILNVKVLGDNGSGSFAWIIDGILYAAGCDTTPCGTPRAEIINMSLGATGSCTSSVQAAIDKAVNQGLVIVAAAGNSGASGAITPANCNGVIGVSASDQSDAKASFSNYGPGVDVAAPGVSILSTNYVGGYSSFNGTSMASPHVAGLAALVWTTCPDNQAVVERITSTANGSAPAGSTHGRIDAYAAVSGTDCPGSEPPPPPPPPSPSLSINNVSANEGNAGTTALTFTVSLSPASTETVTVKYATADGTAAGATECAGTIDYRSQTEMGTLTFAPDETSRTADVLVCGDTTSEANETFFVNLSSPQGATIADGQGQGTIQNDDALPTLSISDVSQAEGNVGTSAFTFTVILSPASGQPVTVNFATSSGTASSGSDYVAKSGPLTFTPGETTKTITVSVQRDTSFEPNETFYVNLSGATNATIADSQGAGTIVNDDAQPSITINDASRTEGNYSTSNRTLTFTLKLSATSSQTVTVSYATANGTAKGGSSCGSGVDYRTRSGSLSFSAGQTSRTVSVTICGDRTREPNETVLMNLTNPVNATISDGQGVGTILNDD